MPRLKLLRESTIQRTPRVMQLEGLFELPPSPTSRVEWDINLPIDADDWSIGVIVGPSGSGKSTLAKELFPDALMTEWHWEPSKSILDSFPNSMGIKEITTLLSQVGFSSPPSWLRPFHVLSNGEQFRVSIARGLAESPSLLVVDEFTSVVDRTVAQIGSAAISKAVRRRKQRFIAVSCHYDILEWLQPDWVFDVSNGHFARDCLQRPQITVSIQPVPNSYWNIFSKYHYLSHSLHKASRSYAAFINGRPVAFTAVMHMPHPTGTKWKEHRTVCLPDFQGIGIGNALSNFIAACHSGVRGRSYTSVTANPAMVAYRARSPLWYMSRKPGLNEGSIRTKKNPKGGKAIHSFRQSFQANRITASFRYIGPANKEAAIALGIR
jgi:ABC-type lipoprotein export system ATPase subunit